MAKWTADDIPDQTGRVVIVTGANSGIGLVAARELARAGATVVLACRNSDKAQAALESIRRSVTGARVETGRLDLSALASVSDFAREFGSGHDRLDLLINNAGVMATPKRSTEDGFELQFGTNHLGHFALTAQLIDLLRATGGSRVVNLSSGAHRMGKIDFDDLQGDRSYRRWSAYGQSKLANLLFTFELQRRLSAAGSDVLSVAAHPGYAATKLQSVGSRLTRNIIEAGLMGFGNRVVAQDDEHGSLPTLYAATLPDLAPGSYVGPDGIGELRGHPKLVGCSAAARDEQAAARLWDVSEQLTGVSFDLSSSAAEHAHG